MINIQNHIIIFVYNNYILEALNFNLITNIIITYNMV